MCSNYAMVVTYRNRTAETVIKVTVGGQQLNLLCPAIKLAFEYICCTRFIAIVIIVDRPSHTIVAANRNRTPEIVMS